jgi:hypothetical protein
MTLSDLNMNEDAFDIFVTFNASEKIEFLSDAMEFGIEPAILKQIEKISDDIVQQQSIPIVSSQDFISDGYRICVTTLDAEIQLNSDSRKTLNNFTKKLFMDGIILSPLNKKKTEMDIYRHFKAYKVVGRAEPISLS